MNTVTTCLSNLQLCFTHGFYYSPFIYYNTCNLSIRNVHSFIIIELIKIEYQRGEC